MLQPTFHTRVYSMPANTYMYSEISLLLSSQEPENNAYHPKIVLSGKEKKIYYPEKPIMQNRITRFHFISWPCSHACSIPLNSRSCSVECQCMCSQRWCQQCKVEEHCPRSTAESIEHSVVVCPLGFLVICSQADAVLLAFLGDVFMENSISMQSSAVPKCVKSEQSGTVSNAHL